MAVTVTTSDLFSSLFSMAIFLLGGRYGVSGEAGKPCLDILTPDECTAPDFDRLYLPSFKKMINVGSAEVGSLAEVFDRQEFFHDFSFR